ncbi:MAG TPA: N-acetylmuramic acid 6-phosphate etherase, partial [Candidatus Dormibacteraeota bacterium]|nr:N-acetylmuramic acid 6-phosphate etherase [Candidatus Dormibacteraeota bacterium]
MSRIRYDRLPTERVNPGSGKLDRLSAAQIARLMNHADRRAVRAVGRAAPALGRTVDLIVRALSHRGRLIFVGAGTSGRLGVLEAAECPPTFDTPPSLVQAVIAGGKRTVFRSSEGAEDNGADGARQIRRRVRPRDMVAGIAASGVTPFVCAALK